MNAHRINNAQLDLLDRPGKGRIRKERALSEHERNFHAAIAWLRKMLAARYVRRIHESPHQAAVVSADDAREIYASSSFPASYAQNRHFFGAIFRGADWEVAGRTHSKHPSNNGREIKTWRYVG